jgi:branched-chain amino acid transport system ATP-binding protein
VSKSDLLSVQNLSTFYGNSQALFDVNIEAPDLGAVAILGRNGAGKTTLLKSIVGELTPKNGAIYFEGVDNTSVATEKRIHRGIGYVPQERAIFAGLTVLENLQIGRFSQGNGESIDTVLEIFPKLKERIHQVAGTLSGGERKMLAIGRALLGSPKLLLLDEPTEGIWVGVIEEIIDHLIDLKNRISLLIVEQHLELALRVTEYAYVLDRGHVALEGPSSEVGNDPQLMRLLAP